MSINIFEPEEAVGLLWHRLVGKEAGAPTFPQSAVYFEDRRRQLSLFFRAMGGGNGTELKSVSHERVNFRLTFFEKLGHSYGTAQLAHFDGDHLFLPESIDLLPSSDKNVDVFKWLTAYAAFLATESPPFQSPSSAYEKDIFGLREAFSITKKIIASYPGLRILREDLGKSFLALRKKRPLPLNERAVEACLCWMLGDKRPFENLAGQMAAYISGESEILPPIESPEKYRPLLPVPLWVENCSLPARATDERENESESEQETNPSSEEVKKTVKANRRKSDQVARRDSILLYPFSGLLSFAAMLNINRKVEDDEVDQAKKALEDQEEIGLVKLEKKAATRLSFDLDLSPNEIDAEKLSAPYTYPEWDYRKKILMPSHARVLENTKMPLPEGEEMWQPDESAKRRIAHVKRQFEALRPKREILNAQMDGAEFDMESLVRSRCDLAARREGSDRIYRITRPQMRDLAVSVLMDVSRSTESWVDGRQVIGIAREALFALSLGLTACGDTHALYGFSSLKRTRVLVDKIKDYDEPFGPQITARISALKPRFYTRLGAGIRHVAEGLKERPNTHRLLLVITDGKPNDLDHYEGRYGVEDTAHAIKTARQQGLRVFGITIDGKAQTYFPHMFGAGGYSIISHPDKLVAGLPVLYRHLVQG